MPHSKTLTTILSLLFTGLAAAQPIRGPVCGLSMRSVSAGDGTSSSCVPNADAFGRLPVAPPIGTTFVVTDASAAGTCAGGGSATATCQWSGSAWVAQGGGVSLPAGSVVTGQDLKLPGNLQMGPTLLPVKGGPVSVVRSGLIGEYRFDDGSGTQLTDYSGLGNHGTLVGSPTWTADGLKFVGTSSQSVALPAGITSIGTVQVFADATYNAAGTKGQFPPTGAYSALFASNTNAGIGLVAFFGALPSPVQIATPTVYFAGAANTRMQARCIGPCDYTVVTGATTTMYLNGIPSVNYLAQGTTDGIAGAPFFFGKAPGLGNQYFTGMMHYALIYNRALTAAEIAQNDVAMRNVIALRGASLSFAWGDSNNHLYCVGDSITMGMNSQASWCAALSSLTDTFTVHNLGISSDWIQYINHEFAPLWAPLRTGDGSHAIGRSVAVIWAGSNDIGASPALAPAIHGWIAATCAAARAAGHQVVVVPMISRTGGADAAKNALNALIVSSWPQYADALGVDPAAHPELYADGSYANPGGYATSCNGGTCFQVDAVHPTAGGGIVLGASIAAAINGIPGNGSARYIQATDPGCTLAYQVGREWYDISTTTTSHKLCLSTSGTPGWVVK